jgi:transcriptional regulator
MYDLPYFKEQDPEVLRRFIREHPFAMICGCDKDAKPVATQIPVFIEDRDDKIYLTGHMMKQTDHHKAFTQNPNALVVFTSPSTYVSATWYSDPHQASTWNYMSVHAKGTLRFMNESELLDVLRKTSHHFENNNAASTTVLENLPKDYVNKLVKAIVGFEIEVHALENVFKLSQNRDEESYKNIKAKLNEQSSEAKFIAEEMEKRTEQLFDPNKEWDAGKFLS